MNFRDSRAAVWAIWGLLAVFAGLQGIAWLMAGVPRRPAGAVILAVCWATALTLATLATWRIRGLSHTIVRTEQAHRATLDEIEQLQTQNAMLHIIARSVDVPLAFGALAQRIVRLVPCDRVGLALLSDDGHEFQTYTARTDQEERRTRPRPEVVFKTERSAMGSVVRSREPLVINNTRESSGEFLDINVLHTAGFQSVLLVPLVSKGRSVGTLNVVSRQGNAFEQAHVDVLLPIAEIFAVAYVAQQLQMALGKYRTMEAMSELTLSVASEINGALQTIIGHCDLLERGYPDQNLQRDLSTVVRQAQRISGLLDKMRAAASERLKEVAESGVIPSSPEGYSERENFYGPN
jgi:signal transduction protein with GAF and PtsI domain